MKIADLLIFLDRLAAKTVKQRPADSNRFVIEMTAEGANLLELNTSTHPPKVLRFDSLTLDPSLTDNERRNAFAGFVSKQGRKEPPKATLCWSEGMTFRQLSLPDMPREDMTKAMIWDLKKKFYYDPDQNLLGYQDVLDVEGVEGPEKLYNIFYCENKLALPRLHFAQSLGLEVDSLVPAPVALAGYASVAGQAPPDKELVICDLSPSVARILVLRGDRNMMVRNVTLGITDGIWADETLARIAEEIRKTVDFYESQKFSRTIGKVLFTGYGPEQERLTGFMAQKLAVPVSCPEPVVGMNERTSSFCTAIGAAILGEETMNLVPSDIKHKNLERKMDRWLTMGLVLFGLLLAAVTGLTALNIELTKRRMNVLELEDRKIQETKQVFERLLAREKVRRATIRGDVPVPAFLKEISLQAPSTVALDGLTYARADGSLALSGTVTDVQRENAKTVTQFVANLAASPFINSVEARNVHQDDENKTTVFEINGHVKGFV